MLMRLNVGSAGAVAALTVALAADLAAQVARRSLLERHRMTAVRWRRPTSPFLSAPGGGEGRIDLRVRYANPGIIGE